MDIEIKGLTKAYGELLLYDNFSLVIKEGCVTALTGPSGCGKTTLLRVLAGLEPFEAGEIKGIHSLGSNSDLCCKKRSFLFPGRNAAVPRNKKQKRKMNQKNCQLKIGYLFQEDRLLPWLTVEENLLLVTGFPSEKAAEIQLLGKQTGQGTADVPLAGDRKAGIEELLEMLELTEFREFYPDQLSGGMQRRVAIGRALAYEPDLLLLDEPFRGLDREMKQRLMTQLSQRWNKQKQTVVMVTHDLSEAGRLARCICALGGCPVEITSTSGKLDGK